MMNERIHRGFSLIELMIALAIIGIVAAIAYPSYTNHVVKSNRSAAQQFMLEVAQRQEQFLMDNRAYATALGSAAGELNLTIPDTVSNNYTITLTRPTNMTYTIKATPLTGSRQVDDGELTLNQSGVKTPADKWK